jgi:hypothetical protein
VKNEAAFSRKDTREGHSGTLRSPQGMSNDARGRGGTPVPPNAAQIPSGAPEAPKTTGTLRALEGAKGLLRALEGSYGTLATLSDPCCALSTLSDPCCALSTLSDAYRTLSPLAGRVRRLGGALTGPKRPLLTERGAK